MKKVKIICLVLVLFCSGVCPLSAKEHFKNKTVKEYDGQGKIKVILQYKLDRLFRKKVYHESGQLILDTVFKDGMPIVIKTYYLNGRLKSIWTQKSGQAKFYYPTGNHKITIPVKNSKDLPAH
jgi:antitoxin component YwqK of YwqJK toxin-antitoxin module